MHAYLCTPSPPAVGKKMGESDTANTLLGGPLLVQVTFKQKHFLLSHQMYRINVPLTDEVPLCVVDRRASGGFPFFSSLVGGLNTHPHTHIQMTTYKQKALLSSHQMRWINAPPTWNNTDGTNFWWSC